MAPDYARFQSLKADRRGPVLWITIDNPPLNAISSGLHQDLSTIFPAIAQDDDVRAVVLTGAGDKAFSAGGDLSSVKANLENHAHWRKAMDEARDIVVTMLECDKPIVARINGHAIGMGATLALCCDITLMSEAAKIGDTHVAIGLAAGDGGALLWPHVVGPTLAKRYLLTGDLLNGREAAAIGLVTEAAAPGELDGRVEHWIDRLANGATLAIRATKRAINMPLCERARSSMDTHVGLEERTRLTKDHAAAVEAFLNRRAPIFEGR